MSCIRSSSTLPRGMLPTLISALYISISSPSFAHDPLRDDHDPHPHYPDQKHQVDAVDTVLNTSSAAITQQRKSQAQFDRQKTEDVLTSVRNLVTQFRQTGDDRNLDQAWKNIEPLLKTHGDDPYVLINAAFIAQARHEFAYAQQLTQNALSINPRIDEGWLLLASIELVLSNSDAAESACRKIHDAPLLVNLTCQARVALIKEGEDHSRILKRLTKVLSVFDNKSLPDELIAWSYSVAGDLAVANNDDAQAIDCFKRSLALVERTQVRAALVDVLINSAQIDTASHTLDQGTTALPLLIRRMIVAKLKGDLSQYQAEIDKVTKEFTQWIAQEDYLHAREMARFYLDVAPQPELARRLALINIAIQKEPEDIRLLKRTEDRSGTLIAE